MGRRRFRAVLFALLLIGLSSFSESVLRAQSQAPASSDALAMRSEWEALNNRAVSLADQGQFSLAVETGAEALRFAEEAFGSLHEHTLRAVRHLALIHENAGNFREAAALFEELHQRNQRAFGSNAAESLASLGYIAGAISRFGRWQEAEILYKQEIHGERILYGADHPAVAGSRGNLGFLYMQQGRHREAEPLLIATRDTFQEWFGPDHPYTMGSLGNLALLYQLQGRYAEAEELMTRVLNYNEQRFGSESSEALSARGNLARLYVNQGRCENAASMLRRSVALAESLFGENHIRTIGEKNSLGVVLKCQRLYQEGEMLFRSALETSEGLLGKLNPEALNAGQNLAVILDLQGKADEAEHLYLEIIRRREQAHGKDHPDTLGTVGSLAALYTDTGRHLDAERLYERVVAGHERSLGQNHRFSIGFRFARLRNMLEEEQLAPQAFDIAGRLISAVRATRANLGSRGAIEAQGKRDESSRAAMFAAFADAAWVKSSADAASPTNLEAEAFAALQDSIAGTANEAVAMAAARRLSDGVRSGLGALARQRQDLSQQWQAISERFAEAAANASPDSTALRVTLENEQGRIEAEMDRIDIELRRDFPQYFALVRPEAVELAAAQEMLAPDEAILLVVSTEFGTHVVGIGRTAFEWRRSDWTREQVNAAVRRLLWDVGASVDVSPAEADEWERTAGPGYPYDRATAYALYRQIVAPVASVLQDKRHVFIAAGGSLSSLPFGILVTDQPQGQDGDPAALRATNWFADAHALVQIPSVQSLQFLRGLDHAEDAAASPDLGFTGFGDPILEGKAKERGRDRGRGDVSPASLFSGQQTRSGAGIANVAQIRRMTRLPGTGEELENMRAALGASPNALYLAERATEGNLKRADLSGTRILALATHGLVAGKIDGVAEPGLVFTPPETGTEQDDGFLAASEVSTLRLDADWVIMSACNTAAGDGSEGAPGLSGLARAFFYAGARNLLASHWPVRDDVAARLTVRTIRLQRETPGLSRAEALQKAMREIRDDASHDRDDDSWAHPNAWAPFTLIGDGAR